MLKNAHLRRQDDRFEPQRTGSTSSAQIYHPSLQLDLFERKTMLCELKNAHLRRQDLIFELQRTTQYASAQILSPSLHLGIFEHKPGCLAKTNYAGQHRH